MSAPMKLPLCDERARCFLERIGNPRGRFSEKLNKLLLSRVGRGEIKSSQASLFIKFIQTLSLMFFFQVGKAFQVLRTLDLRILQLSEIQLTLEETDNSTWLGSGKVNLSRKNKRKPNTHVRTLKMWRSNVLSSVKLAWWSPNRKSKSKHINQYLLLLIWICSTWMNHRSRRCGTKIDRYPGCIGSNSKNSIIFLLLRIARQLKKTFSQFEKRWRK